MASNYPPGMPGPQETEVDFECQNGRCPAYDVDKPADQLPRELKHKWSAPAVSELGGIFLINDDDELCEHCGERGEQRG